MEANPASETLCFSLYICVAQRTKSTRRKVYLYVIHHRQNLTVLKSDFYKCDKYFCKKEAVMGSFLGMELLRNVILQFHAVLLDKS